MFPGYFRDSSGGWSPQQPHCGEAAQKSCRLQCLLASFPASHFFHLLSPLAGPGAACVLLQQHQGCPGEKLHLLQVFSKMRIGGGWSGLECELYFCSFKLISILILAPWISQLIKTLKCFLSRVSLNRLLFREEENSLCIILNACKGEDSHAFHVQPW